ncbi:MAG: ribonuclease P protein component [Muribaculaceae bacterium]|nr:ribonuclease P protein component [Muribaculaceae bacterium]
MNDYRLPKPSKLSSQTAIDRLFAQKDTQGALAYPLRAVWGDNEQRFRGDAVQFLASVPKKRLRHAVDRVMMRRRIREAYRLNRQKYFPESLSAPRDILFVYVSNTPEPYFKVEAAMKRLLHKIFRK